MKKQLVSFFLLGSFSLAQPMIEDSISNDVYNIFYFHTHLLNQRLGDLSQYRFKDGLWLRFNYAQQSTDQTSSLFSSKMQNILAQAGYDYAFRVKGGQDFLGLSFEYGHTLTHSKSYQGSANTFGLKLYNTFTHKSRFYLDTSLKYLFSMQDFAHQIFNSHLILVSLEAGYKLHTKSFFFWQPLFKISTGYSPAFLQTQAKYPLFFKAGSYMGFDFTGELKGDVRFGTFFDSDFFFEKSGDIFRNNYRLNFALEANLHINKKLRFYLGTETSLFGISNIDYAINAGIRFLLGKEYKKPLPPQNNPRTIQALQREMLFQANQSRKRIQEKTYLKNDELQKRYKMQGVRNSPYIQEEIKYDKRQRMLRESSRWIDTQQNDLNYQNRNIPTLQQKDISNIRSYNQREMERKYGK